ncbi:hypothetical protein [Thomasclavelia ramosa]|uniref:hypothetical protein n=1 Tax=Thomasclavelia ramosa TaxID=1547 RepID=UPI00344D0156
MGEDGTNQYTGNSNEGTSEDGTGMTELIPDTQDTGQGYVNYYEQSQGMMSLIFVLVIICAIINIIYRVNKKSQIENTKKTNLMYYAKSFQEHNLITQQQLTDMQNMNLQQLQMEMNRITESLNRQMNQMEIDHQQQMQQQMQQQVHEDAINAATGIEFGGVNPDINLNPGLQNQLNELNNINDFGSFNDFNNHM